MARPVGRREGQERLVRNILIGATAVLLGHAAVLMAVKIFEGYDAVLSFTAVAVILLGLVQLIYVLPLLIYGLWRRRGVAAGAGGIAAITAGFSLFGFLAT